MLGWMTTWGIRCGIATYSRFLVEQFDDVVVLCQSGEGEVEGAIPCWERDSDDFNNLYTQIAAKGIDTLVIQHQPGLLRFKYLNKLLLSLSEMDVKVFITMHNTRDRSLVFPSKRIEKAVDGLLSCHTVMVHTNADVANLKTLGIEDNVVMIPHGIYPPPSDDATSLDTNGRTLGTFGFLLPHKGQLELIEAFARLPGWDSLLMLCATREGTGKTLDKARALISQNNLEEKVTLITDFLDDDVAIATLAKCELLVFPYQNTKESASGAVRMGVASGRPLAVTPIPIFDDVEGAITMRGTSVEDIVASISSLNQSDLDESANAITTLRDSLQWDEVASRIQARLK